MAKTVFLATLLVLGAAAPAGAAGAADGGLNGDWAVTSPLWARPHLCSFRQVQGVLSGYCEGPHGHGNGSGTVHGNAMAWAWPAVTARGTTTWYLTGVLGADGAIHGTLRHGPLTRDFIARRPALG